MIGALFREGLRFNQVKPELTWKDIERIITIENDMIEQYDRAWLDQMPDEEYYKEILKRFNDNK